VDHLASAVRKSQLFDTNPIVWCGCLTAVEILALADAGAEPTQGSAHKVSYAQGLKARGVGGGSWFYYYPGRQLSARFPIKKRHDWRSSLRA
jgi:hypothetical protein